MHKAIKKQNGFTLVELLVAVSIFAVLMVIVSSIFLSVIDGQRNAIAAQTTQESVRFALEMMSKEIRQAKASDHLVGGDKCDTGAINYVYNKKISGPAEELYFLNKNDECVYYRIETTDGARQRLFVERSGPGSVESGYLTPDELEVTNLEFDIVDNKIGEFYNTQPMVTIAMGVKMTGVKTKHEQEINIQTTVTSRVYK